LGQRAQRRKCHTADLTGQSYGLKKNEGIGMTDAPEKIWVDYSTHIENYCHIDSEDSGGYTGYTRTDIAQARIAELQDAQDLGIIQGDIVAHLTVVALTARTAELEAALTALMELNDNHSPFGGEMYQDRIERTWDAARVALEVKP
jgi:hypothetical protein